MHRSPASDLTETFGALADPTRRAILARLARGEASVGDLARPFSISLPAVSRHLRVLEQARLIERRVDAQRRMCRLRAQPLRAAQSWIERYRCFWEERLEDLAALLESPTPPSKRRKR
ncbi:MAG TPA: metalloregulator ArsR/SmtB family transcription factor [Casimicrobiaceae bacterium]|nr:metalloregulator ArsR/SmtB family transcription factor [Casimicrobiaceae bacterium]